MFVLNGLNREQFNEVTKLINRLMPLSPFIFGIVEAFDTDNRTMKVILEPSGIETGWCKVAQGAFCDKIGMEVLVAAVSGIGAEEYVVIHVIE